MSKTTRGTSVSTVLTKERPEKMWGLCWSRKGTQLSSTWKMLKYWIPSLPVSSVAGPLGIPGSVAGRKTCPFWKLIPLEAVESPPWRSSKATWPLAWAACSGRSCTSKGVGPDGTRGPFPSQQCLSFCKYSWKVKHPFIYCRTKT